MIIRFYETYMQADAAAQAYIDEHSSPKTEIRRSASSFTDKSKYVAMDDFILNLQWSGEQDCDVIEVICIESGEVIESEAFTGWN